MNVLGELALWIALPVALLGAVLGYVAGQRQRGDLQLSAERSVYAVFGLTILAAGGIVDAFLRDRFEYSYVASYSNRELLTYFKVSGLWAGQRGSLLFWLLFLTLFSAIAVWTNRNKNREFMPYVVGVLCTIASFFLIVLLFADVNPYEKLGFTPANGQGLNPQLQSYWMTIHPPMLYLGFTSFTIPFAFGVAALMSGRLDSRWITNTRRWTLLSWFFLSVGIILGMRWAYEELGWGGYWFWDPVENASMLPWLSATAFLHSIQIQENRGMLKVWNMGLVILTFLLTIFATFLTRSGLIESVHSFAQELKIAYIFLAFMGSVMAGGMVLILWRLPRLKSENQIESFVSREAAFLFNNLLLLAVLFAVLWGTMLPLLSEWLTSAKIQVGPPFFNRVNIPFGLILLALTGIGPVIAWRRASKQNLRKNFTLPVLTGVLVVVGLMVAGVRHALALTTFGIASFVMGVIVTEFFKGTRARARIEHENWAIALVHLIERNRRRWGGYIVHAGIVTLFAGLAGASFNVNIRQTLQPGETAIIPSPLGHSYKLTYEGMSTTMASASNSNRNMAFQLAALLRVEKDGKPLKNLTTEKRGYIQQDQPTTEVGISSSFLEDLYVILSDVPDIQGAVQNRADAQTATFTFLVNPLVGWIWYGGLIVALGGLIAMWPSAAGVPARASTVPAMRRAGPVAAVAAGD
ncbi:MAG: heme lyase CcmF/NrfE family subunit [Gemmatimonadetes bacterium]|nr:heme lyase CcmF/NrfE family subunit [Gemmatimonadota bacterium]